MTDSQLFSSTPAAIDLGAALDAAVQAAHAGAAVLQAYARNRADLVIDFKARNDLVSQADREAEAAIIEVLRELTPQFGIVAEESGGATAGAATWYIDPLDGTTNFLHAHPHYAVSIALVAHAGTSVGAGETLAQDAPVVAVVYDPSKEELFTAVHGGGAWLNGHRIACSRTAVLADALFATGFPVVDFSIMDPFMGALREAVTVSRGVRRNGAASLDLAWVACGRFDGYWEFRLKPWDVAAGTLLVREAGGQVVDMFGRTPWPLHGDVVAASAAIAPAFLGLLETHLAQAGPTAKT
jgi:myo-inositol-1(or 4)-monophosphatase